MINSGYIAHQIKERGGSEEQVSPHDGKINPTANVERVKK